MLNEQIGYEESPPWRRYLIRFIKKVRSPRANWLAHTPGYAASIQNRLLGDVRLIALCASECLEIGDANWKKIENVLAGSLTIAKAIRHLSGDGKSMPAPSVDPVDFLFSHLLKQNIFMFLLSGTASRLDLSRAVSLLTDSNHFAGVSDVYCRVLNSALVTYPFLMPEDRNVLLKRVEAALEASPADGLEAAYEHVIKNLAESRTLDHG